MKTKLQLLFLAILFSVSFTYAQKTDVWDFGATALDANLYNNQLSTATLNGLLSGSGSSTTNTVGNTTFTVNVLSWVGSSDRLRTTNTALTRYDSNVANVPDATTYRGRLYANGIPSLTAGLAASKYFSMTLAEDDEVTIIARCDADTGQLSFALASNYLLQKDSAPITSASGAVTEVKFVAKTAGTYRIFDVTQKASFFRIYRKPATYSNISGTIDESLAANIPAGYQISFTNTAGKIFTAPVTSGVYNAKLPAGYTYQLGLVDANGYIISNGGTLNVLPSTTNYNIKVEKIDLFTVAGSITGLGSDISKLNLVYTPDVAKVYVPKPVINTSASTYTVDLEANTSYTISGNGVNNFEILANTINVSTAAIADIAFTPKQTYPITINTTGLDATQIGNLKLTFTNLNESGYVYNFNSISGIALRNGTYSISYTGLNSSEVVMTLTSNLKVNNAAASKTLDFVAPASTGPIAYTSVLAVGTDKPYKTINAALSDVTRMTRTATDRVTIMIDPGNYEEMIDITQPNVTLKNASASPSIALQNKGVDIDPAAVRITSYYGLGYNYYSMKNNQKWDADVLRVNKENGYQPYTNVSGTTNNSYWNATVIISANGFIAEDIIIENSYNQYISLKESQDVVELASGNKGVRPVAYGSTAVQNKSFVERAAAFAVKNGIDKVILNKCRVIGRQDSFFGGTTARVVVYKGVMMGGTDYIFGGMNAVFYKTDLAMNTSEDSNDVSYITAAQQALGRGYLMYECNVTSANPGTETASLYRSKPGYFGRPWSENTSEVVFYNTKVETSNNPSFNNASLIMPVGWMSTLAPGTGQSAKMYEYGTIENSGVNNTANRASWSTKLGTPTLSDSTPITTFNFTKGSDNWDPIPQLIGNESLGIKDDIPTSTVIVTGYKNRIAISNVKSETAIAIYSISGSKIKTFKTDQDIDFEFQNGIWIVVIKATDGQKSVKIITN